ncbi:hypothetical protein JOF53_007644 [Crossiella equi]|uniref:Uncharacterized protein n=1 Tax=Crossiella equi TaxID=130796 RepID=A0ABS5AR95_9PSEU|nr:hypothetical protein [Crossiella equi]MBP2478772.1 hypothetical protein [Crossiella equi]
MITWTDQALRAEIDYRAHLATAAMGHGEGKDRQAHRWLRAFGTRVDEVPEREQVPEKDPEEPSEQYRPCAA